MKKYESKIRYTKAPWTIDVGRETTSIESNHWTIASDVSNDDAYLISAAPEMYEALINLCYGITNHSEAVLQGLKAIEKAEGK